MLEWVAFDADDTLWENEVHYRRGRELFDRLMQSYTLYGDLDRVVHQIEITNLAYYGYGAQGFILSLIEAAIELTRGNFTTEDARTLLDFLKEMLSTKVQILEGVQAVLEELSPSHMLALITKGDLRHQQAKIESSGLAHYFKHIEIVSDKGPANYRAVLDKLGIPASAFVMVGNSLPSDIHPVLELGGWAVYVPNPLTWDHEQRDGSAVNHARFLEVKTLLDVPEAIRRIEKRDSE